MSDPIIVIGAGQAATSFIAKLRSEGYDGPITLIGEEKQLPYQRPPLSKKYLLGEMPLARLLLRPASWYEDNHVDLKLGTRVTAINRSQCSVTLDTQETLTYSKLLLATGSTPHQLPATIGGTLTGVYTLRGLADVDHMQHEFVKGRRLLIIGGGYIGLEAAAVAAGLGLQVTVVELAPRILQRVASPATADYFRALHQSHQVTILESTGIESLEGSDGRVTKAHLTNGETLDTDFVITGIGVAPNAQLAAEASLEVQNGIAVNLHCQSSDPNIYSAGDCASFDYQGQRIRLESVQNAVDQAENAALHVLGQDISYHPNPWFWSDQYQTKLQIAGLNTGYTDTVTRPGKREGAISIWYYHDDTLLAVDALNDPIAYTMGRKILGAGNSLPKTAAADPSVQLKDFI